MSKQLIKRDRIFTICTDVLPYETPIAFNNRNIYKEIKKIISKDKSKRQEPIINLFMEIIPNRNLKEQITQDTRNYTIPYQYYVHKNNTNDRLISLIHPIHQCKVADFYDKYSELITYYCSKSTFSLRYPYSKNTKIYSKQIITAPLPENHPEDSKLSLNTNTPYENNQQEKKPIEQNLVTLYFHYKKYQFLYRFFDNEYIKHETIYENMLHIDIHKCFTSIYTHSIQWAIHGKIFTKNNRTNLNNSFASDFDKLMQQSNFNETNGIPIGSEVSRIFAEIILQRIDCDIEIEINKQYPKAIKIYRYVDDFFIFTDDISLKQNILSIITCALQKYNLNINLNKIIEYTQKPFLTPVSAAKIEIDMLWGKNYKHYINKKLELLITESKPFAMNKQASYFINDIRNVCYKNNILISDIASILISKVSKDVKKNPFVRNASSVEDKQEFVNNIKVHTNVLVSHIKIAFFLFNNSKKQYITNILFLILVNIKNIYKNAYNHENNTEKDKLNIQISEKFINTTINTHINFYIKKYIDKNTKIPHEQLDIIQIMKGFDIDITTDKLKNLFLVKKDTDSLSYFEIVVILDYIIDGNIKQYKVIAELIMGIIKHKIQIWKTENKGIFHNTELFYIFFDIIKYPNEDLITLKFKEELVQQYCTTKDIQKVIKDIKNKTWFYEYTYKKSTTTHLNVRFWEDHFTADFFELEQMTQTNVY